MAKNIFEGTTTYEVEGESAAFLSVHVDGADKGSYPVPLENGDAVEIFKDNARKIVLISGMFETETVHEIDGRLITDDEGVLPFESLRRLFQANMPVRVIRY